MGVYIDFLMNLITIEKLRGGDRFFWVTIFGRIGRVFYV